MNYQRLNRLAGSANYLCQEWTKSCINCTEVLFLRSLVSQDIFI